MVRLLTLHWNRVSPQRLPQSSESSCQYASLVMCVCSVVLPWCLTDLSIKSKGPTWLTRSCPLRLLPTSLTCFQFLSSSLSVLGLLHFFQVPSLAGTSLSSQPLVQPFPLTRVRFPRTPTLGPHSQPPTPTPGFFLEVLGHLQLLNWFWEAMGPEPMLSIHVTSHPGSKPVQNANS